MKIFILGYPGGMGGANTECWHTVRLWREAGWEVELVPTWGNPRPGRDRTRDQLDAIGAVTHTGYSPETLQAVPDLPGGIVVGMCNSHFTRNFHVLKSLGCRTVWVNCMTFAFPEERQAFVDHGPADAHIFQSEFQRSMLEPELQRLTSYQPSQGHLVRGAFAADEWQFRPADHGPGEPFVIGKLARPAPDKWSSNHWRILASVPYRQRLALVMGWDKALEGKLGKPPAWAEAIKPQGLSPEAFLGRCHALVGMNGGARENWPRVGLEAMAAGVPLVVPDAWGWQEMVDHGETGYRAGSDEEMAYYLARLAYEEPLRLRIAEAARASLDRLADPERLTADWYGVFRSLGRSQRPAEPQPKRIAMPKRPAKPPAVHVAASSPMMISCHCPTFNRPDQLAEVIECFRRQDYPADRRELVILDDAGQYGDQAGDGWRIISVDRRFRTLGEKRNAVVGLCRGDVLAVWDDDDIYLPWHLSQIAAAVSAGARWVRPETIYTLTGGQQRLRTKPTGGIFHGAWAFTREAFEAADGYPMIQSGQDQGLLKRMKAAGIETFSTTERPSYIYRWGSHGGPPHLSAMGKEGYERRGRESIAWTPAVRPRWTKDWVRMTEKKVEAA